MSSWPAPSGATIFAAELKVAVLMAMPSCRNQPFLSARKIDTSLLELAEPMFSSVSDCAIAGMGKAEAASAAPPRLKTSRRLMGLNWSVINPPLMNLYGFRRSVYRLFSGRHVKSEPAPLVEGPPTGLHPARETAPG